MNVERFNLQTDNFEKIADFFYVNGFVILDDALPPEMLQNVKNDLFTHHNLFQQSKENKRKKKDEKNKRHHLQLWIFLKIVNLPTLQNILSKMFLEQDQIVIR